MPNAAQLAIRLLGAPEAWLAGAPLALHSQKARALLFYLAATGRAHTREHLAALLWGEAARPNARHSLRSSLYHIRQALRAGGAERALVEDGELLRLEVAGDPSDVIRFRRLLAEGSESALAEATILYRGPLLQGFSLADAPAFEEWVRFAEAELSQAYFGALDRLAARAEQRQDWDAAIGYVQQIVKVDPLDEAAQARLIGLFGRRGAVGQALRQYHQLEVGLQHELGLAPSEETRRLFQETLRQQRRPAAGASAPAARPHTLPFVGRDELLTRLLNLCHDAAAGYGATALLQGEGGIGKTRLLGELAERLPAEPQPWIVLQGACSPFDDLLAYGPFFEAFQSTALGDLTDLLLEPGEAAPEARGRFFYRVLHALRALARRAPLLLAIEDLQWASGATLNLFGFIATRLRDQPIALIGTAQRAESIPALQRLITLGRRRGELQLLDLAPLPPAAVSGLLRTLGISAGALAALDDWLAERSGGNPFILAEILAQLRADGILTQRDDAWQLDTSRWPRWRASFALPETTHDLVAWRLANLAPAARYTLDVLAVAGQPLPADLLRALPDVEPGTLLATLEDLLARRLLVEAAGESVALPHHLLRETLLHRLSNLRRRTLHRQLAAALEARPAAADMASQIARHAVAGEDTERARRYGLRVVRELPHAYAGAATVNFLQQLHDLVAPSASSAELSLLTQALGRAHQSLGHLGVAAEWHRQSLRIARDSDDLTAQAAAYFELSELALVSNDYQAAAQAAESGLAACTTAVETNDHRRTTKHRSSVALDSKDDIQQSALAGRGHRLLGAALAMEGSDLPAAERHLQTAAAAHRRADNLADLSATLFELGNVAAQRGELARALERYEEAARAAEAGRTPYILALAHNNIAYHNLRLGRLPAAQRALAQGYLLAEKEQLTGALLHLHSTAGEVQLYLGDWAAANDMFRRGQALAEELGNIERQAGYRAGLALSARGQGDRAGAALLLEEALALIEGHGYWHLRTRLLLWLAETQLDAGQVETAQQQLDAALATAHTHGRALLLLRGERLRARLLAASGDWPAADGCFAALLERAAALDLPLEIARVQAAWGTAAQCHPPATHSGIALIAAARATFAAYDARAELSALPTSDFPCADHY
jgi:DNA-binding SARP family transcriptional activator/predicted ATPase